MLFLMKAYVSIYLVLIISYIDVHYLKQKGYTGIRKKSSNINAVLHKDNTAVRLNQS